MEYPTERVLGSNTTFEDLRQERIYVGNCKDIRSTKEGLTIVRKDKQPTLVLLNSWVSSHANNPTEVYLTENSSLKSFIKTNNLMVMRIKDFEKIMYQSEKNPMVLTLDQVENLAYIQDTKLAFRLMKMLNPYHEINKLVISCLPMFKDIKDITWGVYGTHLYRCERFFVAFKEIDKTKITLEEIRPYLEFFYRLDLTNQHCLREVKSLKVEFEW